jgi:tRNA-dihydrouridine synthase
MVGRAIFGNFWFFNPDIKTADLPLAEKLSVLSDLAERFESRYGTFRSISVLRKHVKGLVHGFPGSAEIREELMACTTAAEFRKVASTYA